MRKAQAGDKDKNRLNAYVGVHCLRWNSTACVGVLLQRIGLLLMTLLVKLIGLVCCAFVG